MTQTSKDMLNRSQVVKLLRKALTTKEYRFARHIGTAWLAEYSGDLEIQLLYATALSKEKKFDRAIDILEDICKADAEYLGAQSALLRTASRISYEGIQDVHASAAALGGRISNGVEYPKWGNALKTAARQISKRDYKKAEANIQAALLAKPKSPLPAIFHLRLARATYDWRAIKDLAGMYSEDWPESVFFKLIDADLLMERGEEQSAVSILHECISADVKGQVARRIWGAKHNYKSLWPNRLKMRLDVPIPAAVSAELGINNIATGNYATATKAPKDEWKHEKKARVDLGENVETTKTHKPEALLSIRAELRKVAERLNKPHFGRADGRFPVYVILATQHGLIKKYGAEESANIVEVLDELATATSALPRWNAVVAYADEADNAHRLGVTPVKPNDPWAIKNYLVDLDESLLRTGQMIGAVLIVGGGDVVPFHMLPNPVDDLDDEVPSDNPYATLDEDYFIPSWPVGRMPGGAGNDATQLLKGLRQIITARESESRGRSWFVRAARRILSLFRIRRRLKTNFGYSAQIWQRASHAVFRIIGERRAMAISPPADAEELPRRAQQRLDLGYYNLHGLADSGEWYGQRDPMESQDGPDYPVALRPQDVVNSGRAPQIVFSEACYGAHIQGKTVDSALSLKFLSAGTKVMVGSTCTSYGSIASPLIAADLLGQAFWKLLKEGYPAGEALRRAKIHLAREMHKRQGYLDGEDQKTLIQFVLYGDPLAQPDRSYSQPGSYQRFANPGVKTVCDKSNGKMIRQCDVPEAILVEVKSMVRNYLPGMAKSKVAFTVEHVDCVGHTCPNQHLGAKSHPNHVPRRRVVTLSKQVSVGGRMHPQYARMTLDARGKVVKLAVSR
ncbi:MAG: hypothetical protein IH859_01560 [Chloroflexi bacterium]|nr:hypothetical protein [Chloroflexota bacterium]